MNISWVDPCAARPAPQPLEVADGIRVRDLLAQLGWREPPGEEGRWGFGVFGRKVEADYQLQDGDRLELCPPLECSPMEARRARANAQKAGKK